MNLSLRQLRAFLEVARHASFTKAAERLHITQAGLSAMVHELEQQLDCRLFERTTRAVRMTAAGECFLPVAKRVVQDLEGAAETMGAFEASVGRRLKVGVTPLIASSVMPEVLKRYALRMPGVNVEVLDADRALIQEGVEQGDLDVGFGAFFSQISGIRRQIIFPSRLLLATARSRPTGDKTCSWEAQDPGSLISLPPENPIQQLVDKQLKPSQEQIQQRRVVTHLQTALAMVEAGLGQAVVPSFVAMANTRWRVGLSLIEPVVPLDYYWISRSGHPISERVAHFVQAFKTVAIARIGDRG